MNNNPRPSVPDLSDVRAADPVRLADLPSPRSPEAQRLLEETMNSARPQSRPSGIRQRLPILGAAAAAIALIATSFAVLAPRNTQTAVAAVKAAAQQAAVADSGRITTVFSIEGTEGGVADTAAGEVEVVFNGDDLAITLDVSDVPDEVQRDEADVLQGATSRIVDGVLYAQLGNDDEWIALELPSFALEQVERVDPRSLLQTIQTLVEAEEVGSDTIDGDKVTLYRSVIDLSDPTLSTSGWMAGLESQLDLETDGTVTVEMAVDSAEQLRRVDVSGNLSDAQEGDASATFSISTEFTDLNNVPLIVAPEGVVPTSMLDGMFETDN